MGRITHTFQQLQARGEKALIIYLMAGDPSLADTEELVLQAEKAGADIIELGVPFSDPIADGPVIQLAAERALKCGTSLAKIFELVGRLRQRTQIPLVLMAYYNTVYAMGEEAFCRHATAAGVDGVIIPDMPPEEAGELTPYARSAGMDIIFLLAPTSTADRRTKVGRISRGFVYYVSLTGITGAKITDMNNVRHNVLKIRREANLPVAVGFGVSTSRDAKHIAEFADGVIVGSAVVRHVAEHQHCPDMPGRVGEFIRSLKTGMGEGP